jgi:hypothetical protein
MLATDALPWSLFGVVCFLLWVVFLAWVVALARRKGRSVILWLILAVFFSFFAWLVLFLLPSKRRVEVIEVRRD